MLRKIRERGGKGGGSFPLIPMGVAIMFNNFLTVATRATKLRDLLGIIRLNSHKVWFLFLNCPVLAGERVKI